MAVESEYVLVEGTGDDKRTTLLENAFITRKNVSTFKYHFDNAQDITESLKKNETPASSRISTHQGRTGYVPCSCSYPDKTTSNNMVMTGLVIQYVKTMGKENARYGKGFFFVGFPKVYIDQLIADATKNSGRKLQPKENVQEKSGYYWISCNSDRLGPDDVTITIMTDAGPQQTKVSLRDTLLDLKQHVECNATVTITGSMTSKTTLESLDLINGTFSLSVKLLAVDLLKETNVSAPELVLAEKRSKETRDDSELNVASSLMAKLALSRLGK